MHLNEMIVGVVAASPASGFADDLLLAEYFHRSANDFAVACAEVYLAGREPTIAGARIRLSILSKRLHALAAIQRLLQPPTNPIIDLGNRLCELCQLQSEARFAGQGASVNFKSGSIPMDGQRGWAMLLIASELLTNAARHAFAAPGGEVSIEAFSRDAEVFCVVQDDGPGFGMGGPKVQAGAGSRIVAALAQRAGICIERHDCISGSRFELRAAG